jgi:Zn-dependent peptidase ImmA (M78 family)
MAKSAEAIVEPTVLEWARTSAGFDAETAAKKAGVPAAKLKAWERGESRPSVVQLRKLGKTYKRPLGVFYLAAPPKDFQPLEDYRRLPSKKVGTISPDLRVEIRRAWDRREIALDLFRALNDEPVKFDLAVAANDESEEIGKAVRKHLGVTYHQQSSWTTPHAALNGWRTAAEACGVLVFQASGIALEEMRGFSLSKSPLPSIVLNIRDTPFGRVFTLAHELAHLALHSGGLCDLREPASGQVSLEVRCNAIAAACLMPRKRFLAEPEVASYVQAAHSDEVWSDNVLRRLSRRYGVSREAVLRRLRTFNLISDGDFRERVADLQAEYNKSESHGGYAPPHLVAMAKAGRLFTRLVLASYHQDAVTAADVADYLAIRLKHLPKIETEALAPAPTGASA